MARATSKRVARDVNILVLVVFDNNYNHRCTFRRIGAVIPTDMSLERAGDRLAADRGAATASSNEDGDVKY